MFSELLMYAQGVRCCLSPHGPGHSISTVVSSKLRNGTNAEVAKTAVPFTATWGSLQKLVNPHRLACYNGQLQRGSSHVYSLVQK